MTQISSLKQLNRLFWSSDSIHLRKTLLIPERIQHQSNGLSLKHTLSAHPQNLRLFGCSETRDSSSPHRNEKEESESRNSSRSNKDLFWGPSLDLNRFRNQLTEEIQNDKLASLLRCLDDDLEYILAALVKPAPDTRPSDTHPIICITRQTIIVSIYYTHRSLDSIIQTKNIDKKSGIPKSPSLNPYHFPPTANPDSIVPLARMLELHPETHHCPVGFEKSQEWTAQRPQWRERIAVVLGDSVKKVVEADVSGRIFKKLAF
ncbi:hypothetical protein BDR26DRAFT_874493 [Obelidium mucronatum]|nr:hypothetical protein BDR26DRAFT_874493 [Obelidium mucronatum]